MKETYTEARTALEEFLLERKKELEYTDVFTDREIHNHIDAVEARCLDHLKQDLAPLIEGLEWEEREEVENTAPLYENSWDTFEDLAREVVTDELDGEEMERTYDSLRRAW